MSSMSMAAFVQVFHPFVMPSCGREWSCMDDADIGVLLTLARRFAPKMFVEMGTYKGGTARVVLKENACIREFVAVDCSDPKREVPLAVDQIGSLAKEDGRYRLIVSLDGTNNPEAEGLKADMVLVDAAHTFDWCVHDTLLARRIVNPGGVIVWHDFGHRDFNGVTKAIVFLNEKDDRIIHVQDSMMCFEMVREGRKE